MRTLIRLFDENGDKVAGRVFDDPARAEEWAADSLGGETSLGLIVAMARFYTETGSGNGEWIATGEEMEY